MTTPGSPPLLTRDQLASRIAGYDDLVNAVPLNDKGERRAYLITPSDEGHTLMCATFNARGDVVFICAAGLANDEMHQAAKESCAAQNLTEMPALGGVYQVHRDCNERGKGDDECIPQIRESAPDQVPEPEL